MTRRILQWLPVVLGIAFLLLLGYLQRERALKGQNDFVAFYVGGKLAGSPDLYSRPANQAFIQSILGFPMENVTYIRPPFYAALLKPLSMLPYPVAYALFTLASLACVVWFVLRFSKECPTLPFFAAMSIPALAAICGGQDTLFLLAIVGGSILLTRRSHDFAAGLLLSLCAIKFHLFLFVPLLLLMKKRWRIVGGGALGCAILTALGILVAGVDSTAGFVKTLRDPWINPNAAIMPNLHGLAMILNVGFGLEAVLTGLVLAGFVATVLRNSNFELLLGLSVVCGLLVSFHSGVVDDVLLLPVFVAVIGHCTDTLLRAAAALILTPVPYFMVLAGAPYSAAFPIALLVLLALLCVGPNGTRKSLATPREILAN